MQEEKTGEVMKPTKEEEAILKAIREVMACEWCGRNIAICPGYKLEAHHIYHQGLAGGSSLHVAINLIALCSHCHRKLHDGNLKHSVDGRQATRRDLWGIAAEREIYRMLREKVNR